MLPVNFLKGSRSNLIRILDNSDTSVEFEPVVDSFHRRNKSSVPACPTLVSFLRSPRISLSVIYVSTLACKRLKILLLSLLGFNYDSFITKE